jgi:cyclophilin family peptidyl-prolyl cis-trans isomerase
LALLAASLTLAACGGGGGNSPVVNNVTATNLRYGSNMTVTATGSGLDDLALTMTVAGACSNIQRSGVINEAQVTFTCRVTGVGQMEPEIRNAGGLVLGRVRVSVPTPQVSMVVRQGDRSGTMVMELDPVAAPVTVNNFISYVTSGFYTNTLFHRVISGRVAQGGGVTTGPVEKRNTLDPIALESNRGLSNLRGTIAMARTSFINSATTQFYINLSDNTDFDFVDGERPGYAVFGRIITGLDVMDEIGKVAITSLTTAAGVEFANLPLEEVVVTSVTQIR